MSAAEIFYVGGMAAISVGFPTLLVAMLVLEQFRAPRVAPVLAEAEAHPQALRRAA